jgi:hypothetical protein
MLELGLPVVEIHQHRLGFGCTERPRQGLCTLERHLHVSSAVPKRQVVERRKVALDATTTHDPLQFRLGHLESARRSAGARFTRRLEDRANCLNDGVVHGRSPRVLDATSRPFLITKQRSTVAAANNQVRCANVLLEPPVRAPSKRILTLPPRPTFASNFTFGISLFPRGFSRYA